MKTMMRQPFTMYGVAIAFRKDGDTFVRCEMFVVSGINPLTAEEVIKRGSDAALKAVGGAAEIVGASASWATVGE